MAVRDQFPVTNFATRQSICRHRTARPTDVYWTGYPSASAASRDAVRTGYVERTLMSDDRHGLMVHYRSKSAFTILEVQLAGQQLVQDVDFVRTRALAARSLARVKFDNSSLASYSGYLDTDADSALAESAAEKQELHGFGRRELPPHVAYGRGSIPAIPNDGSGSAITFAGSKVDFNSRGIVQPMGQGGVVYLKHTVKPANVVAVEVTPAGNVRMWTYKNGSWQ